MTALAVALLAGAGVLVAAGAAWFSPGAGLVVAGVWLAGLVAVVALLEVTADEDDEAAPPD